MFLSGIVFGSKIHNECKLSTKICTLAGAC